LYILIELDESLSAAREVNEKNTNSTINYRGGLEFINHWTYKTCRQLYLNILQLSSSQVDLFTSVIKQILSLRHYTS